MLIQLFKILLKSIEKKLMQKNLIIYVITPHKKTTWGGVYGSTQVVPQRDQLGLKCGWAGEGSLLFLSL
jgi:hypothetical protein